MQSNGTPRILVCVSEATSLAELRRNYDGYTATLGKRWSELGKAPPGPES